MNDLERAYRSGRANITADGDVIPTGPHDPDDITDHTGLYNRYLDTWSPRAIKAPAMLQTDDHSQTCPHCNTAYRISEIHQGCRCPFCWRLVA